MVLAFSTADAQHPVSTLTGHTGLQQYSTSATAVPSYKQAPQDRNTGVFTIHACVPCSCRARLAHNEKRHQQNCPRKQPGTACFLSVTVQATQQACRCITAEASCQHPRGGPQAACAASDQFKHPSYKCGTSAPHNCATDGRCLPEGCPLLTPQGC